MVYYEPVEIWLSYARRASAFLRLAVAVRNGNPRDPADWETLLTDLPSAGAELRTALGADAWPRRFQDGSLREARHRLAQELGRWFQLGGAGYGIRWEGEHPTFALAGGTFAALAAQLLQSIAGEWVPEMCDGCGRPYLPTRKPAWGRPHFCGRCGEPRAVAARLRKRRQREVKRGQA